MASKAINTILNLKDNMSGKIFKTANKVNSLNKEMQRASYQAANMANKVTASFNKITAKAANLAKTGAGIAAVGAAAGGVALVKQSDTYAGIQARLKLINDGQQTVAEFNEKIFKSADRARANFSDMAFIVGKLGVTAGSAFKNNDEILKFSELLSKNFKISGASAEEQSAAMYQLTQAMGAGKLQGDEFRSIMENAPLLAQAISKQMSIPIGQLKEMSSEGLITSDIIKKALFNSADDINKKYAEMPVTFSDSVTRIKNNVTKKLQPTFQKLSQWLNSDKGDQAMNGIMNILDKGLNLIPSAITGLSEIFSIISKIGAFVVKHRTAFETFVIIIGSFMVAAKVAVALKGALIGLQIAWGLLNGTLILTPFGWIVIGIAGLIAAGVLLYKNWDTVKVKAEELWVTIENAFKTGVNGAIYLINGLIKQINKIPGVNVPLIADVKMSKTTAQLVADAKKKYTDNWALSGARNALGTSYFRGGPTWINERGPELVSLPGGSKVMTADKTKQALGGRAAHVYVTVQGNVIGNERYADELGDHIVGKVIAALDNM